MNMKLIPKMPWMPSQPQPQLYICKCKKCGFEQSYETGDFETISCSQENDDNSPIHVDKVPTICAKCGGKMDKTQIKGTIRY